MRTLSIFLLMISTAAATPCDDARKDFERARKFGAQNFACADRYDGTATSSWDMKPEQFKKYQEAEAERQRRRIKGGKP